MRADDQEVRSLEEEEDWIFDFVEKHQRVSHVEINAHEDLPTLASSPEANETTSCCSSGAEEWFRCGMNQSSPPRGLETITNL